MTDLDTILANARETVKNLFPDLPPMSDEDAARIVAVARFREVEKAAAFLGFPIECISEPTCWRCSAPNGTTPGCTACASKRRYDRNRAPREGLVTFGALMPEEVERLLPTPPPAYDAEEPDPSCREMTPEETRAIQDRLLGKPPEGT